MDFSIPGNRKGFWRSYDRQLHARYYQTRLEINLQPLPTTPPTSTSTTSDNSTDTTIPNTILAPLSFPPPPHFDLLDIGTFTKKHCALYTLAEESQVCPLPMRTRGLWDTIYTTYLHGPKNLTRIRDGMEFCVNRVHFKHPLYPDSGSGIPPEIVPIAELVNWHRQFSLQVKQRLEDPMKADAEDPNLLSYSAVFDSWRYKESFGKAFVYVDRLEKWSTEGVLFVVLDDEIDLNALIGEEIKIIDAGIEGAVGGSWRAVRMPIEKVVRAVLNLQGADWAEGDAGDVIVECGWKDREINGTGRKVEEIW